MIFDVLTIYSYEHYKNMYLHKICIRCIILFFAIRFAENKLKYIVSVIIAAFFILLFFYYLYLLL
jgi:hypothetical protein